MPSANVKIDFYRVELPADHPESFEQVLQRLAAAAAADRNLSVAGGWIHFQAVDETPVLCRGTMVRVQSEQLPRVADLAGVLADINLAADQGLASVTHFYYRRGNRVLLLLRNRQGVRAPTFEYFFAERANVAVALQPVPLLEIVRRLKRMKEVKKVQFSLSDPDALHHFRAGRSISSLLDIMNDYNAPTVEIALSIGRRRKSRLDRQKAISLGEQLLRMSNEGARVGQAKVVGWDPEDERGVVLDLLHGRMEETREIPVVNRRLSDEGCVAALEDAYSRKKADLDEMYQGG